MGRFWVKEKLVCWAKKKKREDKSEVDAIEIKKHSLKLMYIKSAYAMLTIEMTIDKQKKWNKWITLFEM